MDAVPGSASHLVVLVHGLWGNPGHLDNLKAALRKAYSKDELHILVPTSSSGHHTYDGIETGAERVVHEIEATIKFLEAKNDLKITKISFTGYSLGGLVCRYAIGLLYANGWFDDGRLQAVNFCTFATPHLGARTPALGYPASLFNAIGSRALSVSGQQLFLMDSFRDTGRPLLALLADPNSVFMRALHLFKNRSLYANIVNDRSVTYYTSAISRIDPFVDLQAVKTCPLPGTEGVILDPKEPFSVRPLSEVSVLAQIANAGWWHIQSLPFYVLLGLVLPLGSVAFFVNSGIQYFRSARRVRLHESGQAGVDVQRFRKAPLLEEAKRISDKVYTGLASEERERYLPDPDSSPDMSDQSRAQSQEMEVVKEQAPKTASGAQSRSSGKFPTLALTREQFAMIDSLDAVGWDKFPVHITKVRHTHAAIVVRMNRGGFSQGKIVIGHWIGRFEV